MLAEFLFLGGVRLSTWICVAAFLVLALLRRDWRPLAAGAAWLWSFEAVFQLAVIAAGYNATPPETRLGWVFIGVPVVVFLSAWVRPDPRLLAAAAACFAAWVLTGFRVNAHALAGLNVEGEVWNEAVKTLCALSYLVPLLLRDKLDAVLVGVDRGARPVGAGRVLVQEPAVEEVRGGERKRRPDVVDG